MCGWEQARHWLEQIIVDLQSWVGYSTGIGSIVKSIRKPYPVGTFFVQVKIHGFFNYYDQK